MPNLRSSLQGHKTTIVAIAGAVATFLNIAGYIDAATYQQILALLGAGGAVTLGAKIERNSKKK